MRILFVCLGNICRSPTAHAIARLKLPEAEIESAGTAGWHIGKPPYSPMQAAAALRGIDMSDLRAEQITSQDFHHFDLIIGMDAQNVQDIEALRPTGNATPVTRLTDYGSLGADNVPDPYFTRDFDEALTIIDDAISGLAAQLTR